MSKRLENKIFNEFYIKIAMVVMTLLYCVPFFMTFMDMLVNVILVYSAIFVVYDLIRRRDILKTKNIVFAILYLASFSITIYQQHFQTIDIKVAIYLFMQLMLFTYCAAFKTKADIKKEMHILFRIILCIGFVFEIISLGMYFLGYFKVFTNDVMDMALIIGKHPNSSLYGIMGNSNWMSFFMVTCTALGIYERAYTKNNKQWFTIVIILSTLSLFLTNSRGGLIGFIVFACVYLLYACFTNINKKKSKYLTIPLCAILLFLSNKYINMIGNSISNGITSVLYDSESLKNTQKKNAGRNIEEQTESTSIRFELWKTSAKVIKDNPLFGVGNANLPRHMFIHRTSENKLAINSKILSANSHNIYIQIMVLSGLVGFIFWISFIISNGLYIFIRFLQNRWTREERRTVGILSALLASYLVINLVEADIFISRNFMSTLFWVILGYVVCYAQLASKENRRYSGLYRMFSKKRK